MQETLCSSILVDNKEIKPFTHLSFTYNCNHLKNVKIISTVDQPLGKSLWETFKDGVKHFWLITLNFFLFPIPQYICEIPTLHYMTLYEEYTPPAADSTFNESHDKEKYLRLSLLYGFPSKKAFGWRLSLYGPPFLALKLASISFCKQNS